MMIVIFQNSESQIPIQCKRLAFIDDIDNLRIDFTTQDKHIIREFQSDILKSELVKVDYRITLKVKSVKIEYSKDYYIIRISYH